MGKTTIFQATQHHLVSPRFARLPVHNLHQQGRQHLQRVSPWAVAHFVRQPSGFLFDVQHTSLPRPSHRSAFRAPTGFADLYKRCTGPVCMFSHWVSSLFNVGLAYSQYPGGVICSSASAINSPKYWKLRIGSVWLPFKSPTYFREHPSVIAFSTCCKDTPCSLSRAASL